MREQLHIGEVAKLIGVSPKTIRYYHEIGLLAEPQRTEAGYRLYSARDLLRLQRIRRLRALGLSLESIKEILGEPHQEHERVLRHALQTLVEELSAQILELEERRARLQKLLELEALDPMSLPDEPPTPLYLDLVRERLGKYLSNMSEEFWQWGEKIDALLGAFHWPEGYRDAIRQTIQHIAVQPEQFQQLFTLEERFAALANAPDDSPEVEQLAEDYARCQELGLLHSSLPSSFSSDSAVAQVLVGVSAELVSPAQRRFFEILSQKLASSSTQQPTENSPASTGE
ncbi:MAG TPA: MerR family transcriptional regulator [Ktedonobacteraceae bacterium]|jgi:DNA-binding transcriptional MerR regulator|nr:MerR family transcriptional regulator [Ktedonobacteraceae bacterium]